LVCHCNCETISLYEAHLRGARGDRLKLSKDESVGAHLNIKALAWLRPGKNHSLFIVRYHSHVEIIPSRTLIFNPYPSRQHTTIIGAGHPSLNPRRMSRSSATMLGRELTR